MSETKKIMILDMKYHRNDNFFELHVKDVTNGKKVILAVKASDFGINAAIPDEIINAFCVDMIGREKNLNIEIDNSSLNDIKKDGETKEEDIEKISNNLNLYPISEVFNSMFKKE